MDHKDTETPSRTGRQGVSSLCLRVFVVQKIRVLRLIRGFNCIAPAQSTVLATSLAELKQAAERRHLTAHLVALDRKSDPGFRQRLAQKIDGKTPGRWIVLEDAGKRLRE